MRRAERPVCYLDLDDTLIRRVPAHPDGIAAPGAGDFVRFVLEHFEVRWLTMWCPGGEMTEESLARLGRLFEMPVEDLRGIRNPRGFACRADCPFKHQGVDLEEARGGRPFVWVEDHLNGYDRAALEAWSLDGCYVECNVTRDPGRLREVAELLVERFALEGAEEAGAAVSAGAG